MDSGDRSPSSSSLLPPEPLFHFVWYGPRLPDFALIAIASALRTNPESRAILWHEAQLELSAPLARLGEQGLERRVIDFRGLMDRAQQQSLPFDSDRVGTIYARLSSPAARSNLLRLAALALEGGVYLDTDTLTLGDLTPLGKLRAYCGKEHVLWPTGRSKLHAGALTLDVARYIYARLPYGAKIHEQLLPFYEQAANNAVLGFSPGHRFCTHLLEAATHVPESEWLRRFRLGTHLLQEGLVDARTWPSSERPTAVDPRYFYPLGPMMSLQYFQRTRNVERKTDELVDRKTLVIHWYASVSTMLSRGARYIRARRDHEVYSHLCAPYLPLFDD